MTITKISDYKSAKIRHEAIKAIRRQNVKAANKLLREPSENFFRTSHLTLEHKAFKALPMAAKLLFHTLCKHRNRYQRSKLYFTRSLSRLSDDMGVSVSTVKRARSLLIEARFIVCVSGKGDRTKWQILDVKSGKNLL
jgi:hypothetical protein|tara:strand:- start:77 stop:490 length:414 start_codon:yes stop_codon:yes gene_type:complete